MKRIWETALYNVQELKRIWETYYIMSNGLRVYCPAAEIVDGHYRAKRPSMCIRKRFRAPVYLYGPLWKDHWESVLSELGCYFPITSSPKGSCVWPTGLVWLVCSAFFWWLASWLRVVPGCVDAFVIFTGSVCVSQGATRSAASRAYWRRGAACLLIGPDDSWMRGMFANLLGRMFAECAACLLNARHVF